MNLLIKQKQTYRFRKRIYGCLGERDRELGMDIYTLLYVKGISNKVLLYSTGNSAQCYIAAWMGGEFGRIDTCIHMTESLCCPPKTITTLLISCIPIQNKKFKTMYK